MHQRKILIITNRIPYPLKDGGNLAMKAMIEGYFEAGWQVYLLSMNTSRHYVATTILESLYSNLYCFEWLDIDNKINLAKLLKNYLFSKEPESAERFYNINFQNKISDILKSFQPDVVQMESVFLTKYLPEIKNKSNAVTVLRIHNIENHIWQSVASKTKNTLKKIYLKSLGKRIKRFEKSAWRKYDLLLPITKKDASYIDKQRHIKKSIVAPFGIDILKLKANDIKEKWVGYHIGAMDWIPNRDGIKWFLDDVWPKVHKALPKFEFYFAGRDMPEMLKSIKLRGVYCMEEVNSADEFIADKKILIVPLGSGSGIRVKILEAMAAGKIVITTLNGIKGIEAKMGVHYLLANRPEEFVNHLKWCLENKEKAEEIAQNAKKLVINKYDYLKINSSIIDELNLIFEEKSI